MKRDLYAEVSARIVAELEAGAAPCHGQQPQALTRQGPASSAKDGHEPLYDIIPRTGVSIEVFFANRTMETFGRGGPGWFWWRRQRGLAPDGARRGPFATRYAAYRHALGTDLGTTGNSLSDTAAKSVI